MPNRLSAAGKRLSMAMINDDDEDDNANMQSFGQHHRGSLSHCRSSQYSEEDMFVGGSPSASVSRREDDGSGSGYATAAEHSRSTSRSLFSISNADESRPASRRSSVHPPPEVVIAFDNEGIVQRSSLIILRFCGLKV